MQNHFDLIIVGARCAGSMLAALSAQQGLRVLLLDKYQTPEEMVLSTHLLESASLPLLASIGLNTDSLAALTPPISQFRFQMNAACATIPLNPTTYCPERRLLDPLLLKQAINAGADFRPGHQVTKLLFNNGKCCGIKVSYQKHQLSFFAPIVVGADGRHSTVARLAHAKTLYQYPAERLGYYAYWERPGNWDAFDANAAILYEKQSIQTVFESSGPGLVILHSPPGRTPWKGNISEHYARAIQHSPSLSPFLQDSKMASAVWGCRPNRFFLRDPIGPGYALIGDAAGFSDPIVGAGIHQALWDAQSLFNALMENKPEKYRARLHYTWERFWLGRQLGGQHANQALHRDLLHLIGNSSQLQKRAGEYLARKRRFMEIIPKPLLKKTIPKVWYYLPLLIKKARTYRAFLREKKRFQQMIT